MKTRIERFLLQVEMAEPTGDQPHQDGTVWTDQARWLEIVRANADLWATMLTRGAAPNVTVIKES
jgi:hypothetical protein